jgi:hypothetical protein
VSEVVLRDGGDGGYSVKPIAAANCSICSNISKDVKPTYDDIELIDCSNKGNIKVFYRQLNIDRIS